MITILVCRNVLMYYLYVYFSVLNVLACMCTVVLSCSVVLLVYIWHWYKSARFRCFPLIVDVFPAVLVCNRICCPSIDLWLSNNGILLLPLIINRLTGFRFCHLIRDFPFWIFIEVWYFFFYFTLNETMY